MLIHNSYCIFNYPRQPLHATADYCYINTTHVYWHACMQMYIKHVQMRNVDIRGLDSTSKMLWHASIGILQQLWSPLAIHRVWARLGRFVFHDLLQPRSVGWVGQSTRVIKVQLRQVQSWAGSQINAGTVPDKLRQVHGCLSRWALWSQEWHRCGGTGRVRARSDGA